MDLHRDDVSLRGAGLDWSLRAIGIAATDPKVYPEYADDYYATFFCDPDGIRLEFVVHRRLRSLIRDHWDRLTEFGDPLAKAGLV